jgi:hypothetical protein
MPKSAYFSAYLEELVDILWKHRAVCGDPAPTGIPLSFEVDETLPPVRDGLYRHTAEEARAALWGEAMKLSRGGFIERVEAGPNGAPPQDFYVNPIVCAFKQPDPGAPADAPAPIRFCLDMSILNKRLKNYTLTHLPDLADYMASFMNKALFTNADLSQAFHQRPVAKELRRFLGCREEGQGILPFGHPVSPDVVVLLQHAMFAHGPEFGQGEVADDLAFAAEFVPAGHRRISRTVLVSVNILFGSSLVQGAGFRAPGRSDACQTFKNNLQLKGVLSPACAWSFADFGSTVNYQR